MPCICPYCDKAAELVTGRTIYPHLPQHYEKSFWLCVACSAYVGCHPGTDHSLGVPANRETRYARSRAHAVFDHLWKSRRLGHGRHWWYRWLGRQLGIDGECHIGSMHADQATQAVLVCEAKIAELWADDPLNNQQETA